MFHKNGMIGLTRTNGTILFCNFSRSQSRLKYIISVMSVKIPRILGNTINRNFRSWKFIFCILGRHQTTTMNFDKVLYMRAKLTACVCFCLWQTQPRKLTCLILTWQLSSSGCSLAWLCRTSCETLFFSMSPSLPV